MLLALCLHVFVEPYECVATIVWGMLVGWLAGLLIGWLVGLLVGWLVDLLVGWFVG